MEHQQHHYGVVKNYTTTALLSFGIVFLLLVSMSRCSGNFKPKSSHHNTEVHSAEQHH
jgi:hypothetical protein